ncbi:GerAB/ArcD/ProY family transporter [Bacillus cereus]
MHTQPSCVSSFFGPSLMTFMPQPILYALKFQSFQIIERTDLLFFSIWTVSITTSIIAYLYIASNGISNVCKRTTHSKFVPYVALFVFLLALTVPSSKESITIICQYYAIINPIFLILIPGVLLLLSIIQGKKGIEGEMEV